MLLMLCWLTLSGIESILVKSLGIPTSSMVRYGLGVMTDQAECSTHFPLRFLLNQPNFPEIRYMIPFWLDPLISLWTYAFWLIIKLYKSYSMFRFLIIHLSSFPFYFDSLMSSETLLISNSFIVRSSSFVYSLVIKTDGQILYGGTEILCMKNIRKSKSL